MRHRNHSIDNTHLSKKKKYPIIFFSFTHAEENVGGKIHHIAIIMQVKKKSFPYIIDKDTYKDGEKR